MTRLLALVGGRVLTVDHRRRVLDAGTVLIEDDVIIAVDPVGDVVIPPEAEVIDTRGHAVIPGLVNTHTHVPQILLRGGPSHDRTLFEWLFTALYPGMSVYDAADLRCAWRLYCAEALRSGVTTIVAHDHASPADHAMAADVAIDVLRDAGIRAVYARMFSDTAPVGNEAMLAALRAKHPRALHAGVVRPTGSVLADLEQVIRRHDRSAAGRIRVCPAPTTASTTTLDALHRCAALARDRSTMWSLHVAETAADRPSPPLGVVDHLACHGLLDARLVAGHCVHVDAHDIRLLARHGTAVSTQPVSNGFLGSGIAPVPEMIAAGIRVGLGTDDANCNDTVNLLGDLKTMAVLHRAHRRDPAVLPPESLVEIVTRGGAAAIGMADRVGAIEVGLQGDLVVLDLRRPHMVPAHDLAATLVWQANGSDVRTVVVAGEVVLRDGVLRFLPPDEEHALIDEAGERARSIVHRAGLDTGRPWVHP